MDRNHRGDRRDNNDGRRDDNRGGGNHENRGGGDSRPGSGNHSDRGPGGSGYGNRDGRIDRAISIASSRGRVLDAGPQGGSVFWVRVATDHGRVDLLVDADSGRIIGER